MLLTEKDKEVKLSKYRRIPGWWVRLGKRKDSEIAELVVIVGANNQGKGDEEVAVYVADNEVHLYGYTHCGKLGSCDIKWRLADAIRKKDYFTYEQLLVLNKKLIDFQLTTEVKLNETRKNAIRELNEMVQ